MWEAVRVVRRRPRRALRNADELVYRLAKCYSKRPDLCMVTDMARPIRAFPITEAQRNALRFGDRAADVDPPRSVAGADHPASGGGAEPRGDGAPRRGQSTGGGAVGKALHAGRAGRLGRCQGTRSKATIALATQSE